MLQPLPSLGPSPRILFVTATRIGDAVLSTGLLAHLVERYPGLRLTVVAGPIAAPLFQAIPGLARLIPLPKRKRAGHWLDLYRQVVGTRWDLVVDLRGSALAWLLWTRHRRMMGKGDPRESRVQQLAHLFALAPAPAPRLWTGPQHQRAALRLVPPGPPVIAIGPTANWPGKQWPAERFAELARRLTRGGERLMVVSAPHERAGTRAVMEALPSERVIDLTTEPDLLTVAAALARARLYVGNDSGLMHMAAAVGTPTLGLFGPSDDRVYRPWGEHTAWVRTPESTAMLMGGPGFDPGRCGSLMGSLALEPVETAARGLIARTASTELSTCRIAR